MPLKKWESDSKVPAAGGIEEQKNLVLAKPLKTLFNYKDFAKIAVILTEYEQWLSADENNIFPVDFCILQREFHGTPASFFITLEEKMAESDLWPEEETKRFRDLYKKAEKVREMKISKLALKRKIDATSSIFLLKAKFAWRDGNEKNQGTTNNVFNLNLDGLSMKELQSKLNVLLEKDSEDERGEAIEAQFEELK